MTCNLKPNSDFMGTHSIPLTFNGCIASNLIDFMEITGTKQVNHIRNSLGRTLDLVLVNFQNIQLNETSPLSKVDSHHPPFSVEITNSSIKYLRTVKSNKINFFKMRYDLINHELAKIDWASAIIDGNIDESLSKFYSILKAIIHKFAKIISPKCARYPKWFSRDLIEIL